jgi:putative endonuclease
MWRVYILRCADGTLYTGVTTDLDRRLAAHTTGRGARYTRGRGPFRVLVVEDAGSRGDALRRELAIKRMSRRQKLRLRVGQAFHEDLPLGLEGQALDRRVGRKPGGLVDLTVVVAGVARLVADEVELHGLFHALPARTGADVEPENDDAEVVLDEAVAARLFADLAPGRLGQGLLARDVTLGELPARAAPGGDEADLDRSLGWRGRVRRAPKDAARALFALGDRPRLHGPSIILEIQTMRP